MERALRPWVTTGVALTGASIIAITPAAAPLPNVQHRLVQLTTVDAGEINFPEVDWNDFVANTTANWNGLTEMFNNTTAIYSLPDAVYTQGLPQVFTDLSTDLQALAKYSTELAAYDAAVAAQNGELDPTGTLPPDPTFPDLFGDPLLNPVSALTLLLQNGLSSDFGENALQVGWTGIYQNMLPSINDINTQFSGISTQVENLFTGGSFSTTAIDTDFTNIGTDFTNIEKFLSLAPTTLLNDYLNGYQVESAAPDPLAGTIPSIGDAYTLNAPYTATDNVSITPEYGLLTNPDAVFTTDTSGFGDGTSSTFLGTVPLDTGTLASLLQSEQTLSDELLTETSTIAGSGVSAPPATDPLEVFGPNSMTFTIDLDQIPVLSTVIDTINNTIVPTINTTLLDLVNTVNDGIDDLNNTIAPVVNGVLDIYNGCAGETICDGILDTISKALTGNDAPGSVSTISSSLIPTIPLSDVPTVPTIPVSVSDTVDLPNTIDPGVPGYTWDLTQNEMAILSSFSSLAAPVTGTVSSDNLGNFLAENPVMNLGVLLDELTSSFLSNTPLTVDATLPLDWTNLVAESLNGLFTA
jgi:hypothetical protein